MGAKKEIMNDYKIQEEMRMAVITMMQRMWMQQLMMLSVFYGSARDDKAFSLL